MADSFIGVSELNEYVRISLEQDLFLSNVHVLGEISGLKIHSSGHIYFTLKDDKACVRCSFFRQYNYALKFRIEEGMKIAARGKVSLYTRDGQYQLYIYELTQTGLGDLFVQYNELKKKLEQEGLFAKEHKRSIPFFVRKLGVVTSPTGAVIRDIINVAVRRFPDISIVLAPVKVQGEGAAQSIVRGIEYINTLRDIDALIVGRGGGSAEDLWPFNEEIVARAVYASSIPVISAVGHETDFTITDFAADLRAPTPSAAAELAVFDFNAVCSMLKTYQNSGENALVYTVKQAGQRLAEIKNKSIIQNPVQMLNPYSLMLDNIKRDAADEMEKLLRERNIELANKAAKLHSLSPLAVLSRGYAAVTDSRNVLIKSINDVKKDMPIQIRVSDGTINAEVK